MGKPGLHSKEPFSFGKRLHETLGFSFSSASLRDRRRRSLHSRDGATDTILEEDATRHSCLTLDSPASKTVVLGRDQGHGTDLVSV